MKYLTLIRAIALLHQYQRPVKTVDTRARPVEYIEVTREDIAMANRLAHEVLGRSLDELPPQTRRLLLLIDEMVTGGVPEARARAEGLPLHAADVREATGWGNTQLEIHLQRLDELEYLLVHPGGQARLLELVYDGQGKDGRLYDRAHRGWGSRDL